MSEQEGQYKGLLSSNSESLGGKMLDKAIVAKGLVEAIDGPVATLAIRGLDNYLGDRVPQEYEEDANLVVEALHDAYCNGNKESYGTAVKGLSKILKGVLPLEKLISQAGEDAIFAVVDMVAE